MKQWHTQPPPSIENTSDLEWKDVNLDSRVPNSRRLEEFGDFLRERGYVPPKPFKNIGDFLTNGTKLQIMGAVSYDWNRKEDKVRLVPQSTYEFPRYTYGLNDRLVYRCCGYPRTHPGCWTGPVLYEYTKFKVNVVRGTVETGTYWKTNDPTERIKAILKKGESENDLEYMMLKQEFEIEEEKESPPALSPLDSPRPPTSPLVLSPPDSPRLPTPPLVLSPPDSPRPPTPPPSPPARRIAELIKQAKTFGLPENIDELKDLSRQLQIIDPGNDKIQKIIRKIKNNSVPVFNDYMAELKTGKLNINFSSDRRLLPNQKEALRNELKQWAVTDPKYKKLAEGDGFGGTVGLKWCANSCWIDTIFTSLFLLENTSIIREILETPKRLTFKEGGCTAQEYHEALLNDIDTLQNSSTPTPSKLREIWYKCIQHPVPIGNEGYAQDFIVDLIALYGLKTLEPMFDLPGEKNVTDWIYVDSINKFKGKRDFPMVAGEYNRKAIILRRNNSHFVTILYDGQDDYFINVLETNSVVKRFNMSDELPSDTELAALDYNPDDNPFTYEIVGLVYMRDLRNIKIDETLQNLKKKKLIPPFNNYKEFIERFYGISVWKKLDFATMNRDKQEICLRILLKIAQRGQVNRYGEAERRILKNEHKEFDNLLLDEDVKPEVKTEMELRYVMGAVNDI